MKNFIKKIEKRELKISILGMGYIGLPTAIIFAKTGFTVYGFDINKNVINTLKSGHIHIVEPDLQEAFKKVLDDNKLIPIEKLEKSDVFIISVPTPFKKEFNEKIADLTYVENATKEIAEVLEKGNLVILESTVPPKTTKLVVDILLKETNLSKDDFMVAHCPERVLPGRILYELENNDRIIGAEDKNTREYTKLIYETFVKGGKCYTTDDITAEMCKLVENTFRDVNIAFANELSIICDKLGINVFELIKLANKHPRVNILTPGAGVGGHCLAVDPWFIVEKFPKEANVIRESREINDFKPEYIANKVDGILNYNKGMTIGVLGLAYKPDIDDLRESPAMEIVKELHADAYGAKLLVVEPNISEHREYSLTDASDAYTQADIVVFLTAHKPFFELPFVEGKQILDFCGVRK